MLVSIYSNTDVILIKRTAITALWKSAVNKQSAVYLHSHILLRPLGIKNAITIFFQVSSIVFHP